MDLNNSLDLPGEWTLKKLFGPTLDLIGEDFANLYIAGRNQIILAASRKIKNANDKKKVNLRVARDVFWNGSFTQDSICAEYFGGILASSRSTDGNDDNGIQYTDVIKSLSSRQLHLHYVIYNSLNKWLVKNNINTNVGQSTELSKSPIFFFSEELQNNLGLEIDTNLNILFKQGLISRYKLSTHNIKDTDKSILYTEVTPTTFGILLYSISHNKFSEWRNFNKEDFGDFPEISLPEFYCANLEALTK